MRVRSRPSQLLPLAAAACAAIAAWLSFGALAVSNAGSGSVRFGFLPPLWLLPLLMAVFIGGAQLTRLTPATARPLFFSLVLLLPWLPFGVPAAFLIWTGHVTVAVWLAVAAGMFVAHGIGPTRFFTDARLARRAAAGVACVLYLFAGYRLAALIPGGDEPHYLVITQSLLKDGDLQIENNHAQDDYREYFSGRLAPDYLRRGTNGQIYSIHAPGLSVVVAPAFALLGYPGVVVLLAIIASLGSALLWRASHLLTGSIAAAWFGWAAGALTVPFFFQAFAVYPDGLGATLVLFAVSPLFEDLRRVGKGRWLAISLVLALLPWLHTRFAILAGAIGCVLLLRLAGSREGRARIVALFGPPIVSALAWFGYFKVIYGTFNPSAPYGGDTQSTPGNILNGLPALFFDQQFGILPNAPVYAVCIAGLFLLARRRPRLALELLAIALPYLLVTSMFHMWWAGSVSPARLVVPLLPLLALPGAWLWSDARHAATRAMALALMLLSVANTMSLLAVDAGRLVYNFRDGYSLAAERLSSIVDLPQGLPSFFRQSPAGAVLRAMIWLTSMSAAWLALVLIERRSAADVRSRLALWTPVCLAATVMIAASIEWRLDRVPALTAETSQLSLLSQYHPRLRPVGIAFSPLAMESPETILGRIAIATPTRRPPPPARTLLIAPGVIPAGEYELRPRAQGAVNGEARLIIGRMARPIRSWKLSADRPALTFELPVDVGSLVVEGDDTAAASGGLELIPRRLASGDARLTANYARRAERYGPALVFFFDDGAFPEAPGFWVRGAGESTIAVMPDERGMPLQLFVRNAPVKNRLTLDVGGRQQSFDLQPGEERLMPLQVPPARAATIVRLHADSGFRPSAVEPGSTDNRFLGVWIELRP